MASTAFWRRTPPALFPVCLGMIGIGWAWLRAAETLGAPRLLAVLWIAVAGVAIVFCLGSYFAKLTSGLRVVLIDLNPAPGRAAVSAGSMCMLMLAAALAHLTGEAHPAFVLWGAGLVLHVAYAVCVLCVIVQDGLRNLRITPVLFLPFVGFIVAPAGGVELGQIALSHYIFWWTLPVFLLIFVISAPRFILWPTPIPQRAAAAIFLAPTSVFASAAFTLSMERFFDVFFVASCAVAVVLLICIKWLTKGGWTPLWGAFTFPLAAFATTCVIAATRYDGVWLVIAWGVLIVSSVIVATLFALTIRAWARGQLAPATGAAVAP